MRRQQPIGKLCCVGCCGVQFRWRQSCRLLGLVPTGTKGCVGSCCFHGRTFCVCLHTQVPGCSLAAPLIGSLHLVHTLGAPAPACLAAALPEFPVPPTAGGGSVNPAAGMAVLSAAFCSCWSAALSACCAAVDGLPAADTEGSGGSGPSTSMATMSVACRTSCDRRRN